MNKISKHFSTDFYITNLKWSHSLDDLINDELGRKLFSYYLKKFFESDQILMLYTIFKCLPECDNNDRRKKMLKCTFNSYFKSSNPLLLEVLKEFYDILHFKLENKQYDFNLISEARKKLKIFLEIKCYSQFLKSKIYVKSINLLQNKQFLMKFLNLNNADEQVKLIIDTCLNEDLYSHFNDTSVNKSSNRNDNSRSRLKNNIISSSQFSDDCCLLYNKK
jgi:hypothetical protein